MKILIDTNKCKGAGKCITACPENAISVVGGVPTIDYSICDLDGICIPACPNDAISLSDEED